MLSHILWLVAFVSLFYIAGIAGPLILCNNKYSSVGLIATVFSYLFKQCVLQSFCVLKTSKLVLSSGSPWAWGFWKHPLLRGFVCACVWVSASSKATRGLWRWELLHCTQLLFKSAAGWDWELCTYLWAPRDRYYYTLMPHGFWPWL